MTEQEWLVCEDPRAMYAVVNDSAKWYYNGFALTDRRWRLLACAMQAFYSDYASSVDDLISRREVITIIDKARLWADTGKKPAIPDNYYVTLEPAHLGVDGLIIKPIYGVIEPTDVEANRKFADLFREVIGNPFRRQKWSTCEYCYGEGWRTKVDHDNPGSSIKKLCRKCGPKRDVLSIAQQIYDTQDYAGMPILADAMEEAGCEPTVRCPKCEGTGSINLGPAGVFCTCKPVVWGKDYCRGSGYVTNPILEHLRGGNTHVRGCWVLDLILGKE